MPRIRFTSPIRTDIGAEPSAPKSLHNAYLDREDATVVAANGHEDQSFWPLESPARTPLGHPSGKPVFVHGQRLIDVVAGDVHNEILYAVDDANGLVAYPSDYDGTNESTAIPHVLGISHLDDLDAASFLTTADYELAPLVGHVHYLVVPFNSRGEAGPSAYSWDNFRYLVKDFDGQHEFPNGDTNVYRRTPGTIIVTASEDTSYVQIYRSLDNLSYTINQYGAYTLLTEIDPSGPSNARPLYYMGRYQVNKTDSGTNRVSADDQYVWWATDYHARINDTDIVSQWQYQVWKAASIETVINESILSERIITVPATVYDRDFNTHDNAPGTVLAAPDLGSGGYGGPHGLAFDSTVKTVSATSMLFTGGVMYYGNVEWPMKTPQVGALTPDASQADIDEEIYFERWANVAFQYEYKDSRAEAVLGPILYLNDVHRASIAWQGEAALHMYLMVDDDPATYILRERLVPNELGMYVTKLTSAPFVRRGLNGLEVVTPPTSYWTFDVDLHYNIWSTKLVYQQGDIIWASSDTSSSTRINYATDGAFYRAKQNHTPSASNHPISGDASRVDFWELHTADALTDPSETTISEPTTVLMSALNRPLEVTFASFMVSSPIEALVSSRLEEEEGLRAYDFYVATGDKIYSALPSEDRSVSVSTVEEAYGIDGQKYVAIPQGGVMVGSNGFLYQFSGRRFERIDQTLPELWAAIYDVAYHRTDNDVYVLTDTGIWVYDLDVYNGIYKHMDYSGSSSSFLFYLSGMVETFGDVVPFVYDHIIAEDPVSATTYIIGNNAQATDASITTQPIRLENIAKVDKMSVDFDEGAKSAYYYTSGFSANPIVYLTEPTDPNNHGFVPSDVGAQILLGGVTEATLATITTYTSATQVSVSIGGGLPMVGVGVGDPRICIWPIAQVTHTAKARKTNQQQFNTYPQVRRFPKLSGLEHQLKVEKFKELFSMDLEFREL